MGVIEGGLEVPEKIKEEQTALLFLVLVLV